MGMEFEVNNLEDMCSLMCDNAIPKSKNAKKPPKDEEWVFTFGADQPHAGYYVTFTGTYGEARSKMIEAYGNKWAFQYSRKEWDEMANDPNRMWDMEKPLEDEENA